MSIYNQFRAKAKTLLKAVIKSKFNLDFDIYIDVSKHGFGDLSYACFELAKVLKKNPAEIATILANVHDPMFKSVIAIGAYVNFYISPATLAQYTVSEIIALKEQYGASSPKHQKVIVEHTSANPTGPLHIGRARNTVIGDTLARILRKYGYEVTTQYYVNDIGKQAAMLVWGIREFKTIEETGKQDAALVKYYQRAAAVKDLDQYITPIIEKFEQGDKELISYSRHYISQIIDGIRQTVEKINVKFDMFFYESDLILDGSVQEIKHRLKPYLKTENEAKYIDLYDLGAPEHAKIFLFRKDGTSLYITRDLAYHLTKAKIAQLLINVLGEDHKMHAATVSKIMKILVPTLTIKPIFYSFVSLPEGKMSTRKGKVVYLDTLIDVAITKAKIEILKRRAVNVKMLENIAYALGTSAVRYNIIKVQNEKSMVFDWNEALNFEGDSAPFILYTSVRANSILRKAQPSHTPNLTLLVHPQEFKLIKLLAQYGEVIKTAATEYKPYKLAKYCYELATQFNQFYRDCPVLHADPALKNARLTLVQAFDIVIKDGIRLLGLNIPKEM